MRSHREALSDWLLSSLDALTEVDALIEEIDESDERYEQWRALADLSEDDL